MSLNPDIRDQAYQFFIEEAQELLQVLEKGLLDLRQDHSTPKVHELMRAAHSIKGGAASVELSVIELLAHRLEDFFKALYSDEVEFDAELEGLLLQGYDCLSHPLTEQIEVGAFDEEAALLTAEPVFAALEVRLENALKNADNYIPSSNDLGVDIVASIFEVDVVQALEHLNSVITNVEQHDPSAELQGTLEMFAGFAELFNLPGFSEIVETAQAALSQSPHRAVEIIHATVSDCTLAKDLVLGGDRTQGGTVSAQLLALAQTQDSDSSQLDTAESNLVLEEIGLEQDSLWSELPTADSPAENIFAALPEENQELETGASIVSGENGLEQDSLWSELPAAESLAEDIFAILPEENVELEAAAETESRIDDISEIFGIVADQSTEAKDIVLTDDSLGTDTTIAELSAEDVFANIPEVPQLEEASAPAEISQDLNLFFEQTPPESAESETIADSTETADDIADDISEIFGIIPPVEMDLIPETIADDDDLDQVTELAPDLAASSQAPTSEQTSTPQNLTAAIESIEDIFDNLPQVSQQSNSLALPSAKVATSKAQTPKSPATNSKSSGKAKATAKLSVRVDLNRLERMNNLVGELTINRNSLALQNNQLQDNVSELGQKFLRFREVTRKLREISDQMLLEQRSMLAATNLKHQQLDSDQAIIDEVMEFDSLEMDSYSILYSSLQEVLEEIVQLEESVDDITIFAQQSNRTINNQRQMLEQMRDELMWVRMLPLDKILQRFPRTLRELSTKYRKPVELKLQGTGVLVDKAVLEKLSDPLLHLLRNGFDHGIEESTIRVQQGKSATGSIEIRAYYQGNQTVIEIKDDGKGLDVAKIKQKAVEKGLISPQEAETATQDQIFDLIFEPGFSTASTVSELSGRGVGMNIVRSQIETLKGKIGVTSIPGQGCTFTLRLPLTLTIAKLLVCSLGSTAFAIPSDSIEEIIIPTTEQIKFANEQKFLSLNTRLVPIYSLKEILSYNCPIVELDSEGTTFKTIAPPSDWLAPLLLLRRGQQLFALEIVSLLSEQELVIKPYGGAIAAPNYSYGCTILSDGSLIPAFDGAALISTILGEETRPVAASSSVSAPFTDDNLAGNIGEQEQNTAVKTIMVVDDSTALRRTMALTLEKEGYRVVQKKDGKDALDGFKQNPNLALIICDIEMPVMNGFEFLGMRRRDSALSQIPTFMLTSRSGAKHRNLAKQLGADGYFTKPYVESEFVQEVNQILVSKQQSIDHSDSKAIAIETKTILVIDDSSALRRTLALSLERRGYRVLQGRDGLEGLQQLRDNLHTDLVICDIEMPNVNGFEFLTTRRQEPPLTKVPVVMLTSRASDKHRVLATNLGAAGFFTKPYVEEKFMKEIKKYL
ncbi:MAG: hybrid sensor histidine kinase/response regulator [Cyanobacteria bacterium J06638_38]